MVVVESDLLSRDAALVVIPFLPGYPAVRHLSAEILHDGKRLVLATRLIAGAAADQGDQITRAVDVLLAGAQWSVRGSED